MLYRSTKPKFRVTTNIRVSNDPEDKKWYPLIIDGCPTFYKVNRNGVIKGRYDNILNIHNVKDGYVQYRFRFTPEGEREKSYVCPLDQIVSSVFCNFPKDYDRNKFDKYLDFVPAHIDNNPKNCSIDNLILVDPEDIETNSRIENALYKESKRSNETLQEKMERKTKFLTITTEYLKNAEEYVDTCNIAKDIYDSLKFKLLEI